MSESAVFEWLSDELERRTSLSRNEARGTVRLVLKDAGLEPTTVNSAQLGVVIARLLPVQLDKRRVTHAAELCVTLGEGLKNFARTLSSPEKDTAYEVFQRIGSDTAREKKR